MTGIYTLGKLNRQGTRDYGPRNCLATLTWTLDDGRFSMHGDLWNHLKTDIVIGGQCVDRLVAQFPRDQKAHRMLKIWERWHCNNMRAGSPVQEQWLRDHPHASGEHRSALTALDAAGLNPDADGYVYGSAWLRVGWGTGV